MVAVRLLLSYSLWVLLHGCARTADVWYLYDGLRPTEWSDWQRRDTTLQCDADDRTHHSKRFARDGLDDRAIAELHVHVYWHADRTSRCRHCGFRLPLLLPNRQLV